MDIDVMIVFILLIIAAFALGRAAGVMSAEKRYETLLHEINDEWHEACKKMNNEWHSRCVKLAKELKDLKQEAQDNESI